MIFLTMSLLKGINFTISRFAPIYRDNQENDSVSFQRQGQFDTATMLEIMANIPKVHIEISEICRVAGRIIILSVLRKGG